ncbi:four helix bundle protein [Aquibium microcysteis]|uniref:four helix bundle protein n=1 Tax=Aquibium microcysteis TaxID=675281 RepID=UPI00165D1E03|nr:four helix bundle protein [Aquibium microcysteis]
MTSGEGQSAVGSRQSGDADRSSLVRSYRDLRVWKLSIELIVECYEVTKAYPAMELYGLTSQIRRSATSIAANISEGYGRENKGSYLQFLRIAQGSLKELETHLIVSGRLGMLDQATEEKLLVTTENVGKMLRALIRSLEKAA